MVHPPAVHRQIQFLGFETSLNSIVATPSQYSVHLPIFSIAGRASSLKLLFRLRHSSDLFGCGGNCDGHPHRTVFDKPSTVVLSTTEYRPLGNHPGLELKLPSPISHGEACIRSNAIIVSRDATFSAALPTILEDHKDPMH